jgi:riboflavin synthase
MFTGVVETLAPVLSFTATRLVIERPKTFDDIQIGSSIAVSGVCLTVVALDQRSLSFDVIPESFDRSHFGSLKPGDQVNLERAMRADSRLEGHIVQGHVEGIGEILSRERTAKGEILTVLIPLELQSSVISKGSIALDGVSLTVMSVKDGACSVALIPLTIETTTLGLKKKGDFLTIETDILARYAHQ